MVGTATKGAGAGRQDADLHFPFTGDTTGVVFQNAVRLFNAMFDLTRQGRDVKTNPDRLKELQALATSVAFDTSRSKFDPSVNPEDRAREEEYIATNTEIQEARQRAQFKERDLEQAEQQYSAHREDDPRAQTHLTFALFVTALAFSTTLAPTSHDAFFYGVADDALRWTLSIGTGALVAIAVVWASFMFAWAAAKKATRGIMAVIGGVTVFAGFGFLRLAGAVTAGEVIFASALTLAEIGMLVLLHTSIHELSVQYHEWSKAKAVIEALRLAYDRAKSHVAELERRRNAFIDFVEDRTRRNIDPQQLVSIFEDAVAAGHAAGIEVNEGYLRGAGGNYEA